MIKLDPEKIKRDFPILFRTMGGKPLVYLDNAATSQKPIQVIEALSRFYRHSNANIHRGVYDLAEEATTLYENTRKKVAQFINAPTSASVIFTRNTTESINLVAHSWAKKFLKAGDEILISDFEHHANIVPWYFLAQEIGIKLKSVPFKADFTFDLDAYRKLLTPQVKLVAMSAMSNVLGTILPSSEITRMAHANHSLVLLDGAQSVPHLATDVQELDCDFLAFSAHKMLGPTGVGVLWVKEKILEMMDPFMGGGEMISTVSLEKITWASAPHKFEAGTPNFADVAAFSASLDYLELLGMETIRQHDKDLISYALMKMEKISNINVYGPKDAEKQSGAISFNHKAIHAHDVGTILGEEGVAIRVGHHCAQPLMRAMGVPSTARISFYLYNTKEDVDIFLKALSKVDKVFGLAPSKESAQPARTGSLK